VQLHGIMQRTRMMMRVIRAVCCSVVQCVTVIRAVCCSVVQCVTVMMRVISRVCCSVLQSVAVRMGVITTNTRQRNATTRLVAHLLPDRARIEGEGVWLVVVMRGASRGIASSRGATSRGDGAR